ncbi:MAG: ATP-binding cassette domain-containing protein [Bacteroidales bacterium]|nr:ATP-binding cassette domain-containing protein [Bacteroidales bacterium]
MINIENLDFSYQQAAVFKDISLQFKEGNIYGLLGENGVGKTTLLKIISGLQRPTGGRCEVDGMASFDCRPEMLRELFFMPDSVTLPDDSTPEQYIKELGAFYPFYSHDDFLRLMHEMEVDPLMKFQEMSTGMQKKSLLACALCLGTKYLLLDEPTNGLDIPSKSDFRKILMQRMGTETTIIISTHQVKDVENLIDPIVIISHNELLLDASVAEISKHLFFEYGTILRHDALYSEMQPGGYLNVVENIEGKDSPINIEALFNAVLKNTKQVKQIFNK